MLLRRKGNSEGHGGSLAKKTRLKWRWENIKLSLSMVGDRKHFWIGDKRSLGRRRSLKIGKDE